MFGLDAEAILLTAKAYSETMISNLNPTVTTLMGAFVTIDLVLSFLFDESDGLDIFMKLIKKILYYGFWIWIIQEYSNLVFETLMGGAIQLGNVASGNGSSTEINVTLIEKFGLDFGDILQVLTASGTAMLVDYMGVESGTTVLMMGIMGYVIFFVMLYVQILITFVKFYLVAGYGFLLMPFGCFSKTKDIALKGLNGLFSQAIEIFVLITILNIASDFMDGTFLITLSKKVSGWKAIKEGVIFQKTAILMFLYLLINRAGSIASALLSGAIASIGIGSQMGAQGFSNAVSTPGRLAGNMANSASRYQRRDDAAKGGAKAFRDSSYAASAYKKAADGVKNFASRFR
ncbi:hypothetical protein FSBG_00379 [Fusobacterium gonidiaformans 3-1-5R]|uniref:P-type conjugative transfer protein TrbL n=1 Tax=Fusobacterium gonidiaformans 3-1-5R TaxID=469605 RepID=E5BFK1_9FUSO|nr:type IV secretion system protein [Fusobacterium gonidiaformans]EFS20882.1 hypothetical protein FSBG_00379 [Fusobacterium gonidiaformans 3-1-5R]